MSTSAAAQEPSMEEILASIRRIITDEEDRTEPESGSEPAEDDGIDVVASDSAEQEEDTVSDNRSMSSDDLDALFVSDTESVEESASDQKPGSGPKPAFAPDDGSEADSVVAAHPADDDDDVVQLTAAEIDDEDDAEFDAETDELPIVEGMDVMFDEDDGTESADMSKPADADPKAQESEFENLISRQTEQSVSQAFSSLSGLVVSNQTKTMEDLVKEMLRPMLQSWLDQNLPPLVEKMVAAEIRRLTGKN